MIQVKDKNKEEKLKRLKRLKKLIVSEIEKYGQDDLTYEMTIIDLQEWLRETDAEILKMMQ